MKPEKFYLKILFVLIIVLIFSENAFSQSLSIEKNVLPPPKENLVAVRFPDLKGVEAEVSEHISSFQQALIETVKTSPANAEKLRVAYSTLGQIYHAYSFLEPARECYTNASRLALDDFRWLYLLGKVAESQNKTEQAIDFYKRAQKLGSDYPPIFINLGNIYLEQNSLDNAKENFESALKLNPENPAALYGAGRVSYSRREYEKAISSFEKALNIAPGANRVHYSLALAYRDLKNTEKAKFHLSKQGAVGVRPDDPIFDRLDDFKEGVRLRLSRGKTAFEAGRFAEAEIEFQKALSAEPENVSALVNYGVTLVQLKKYAEAVKHFEKAIAADPGNVNAHYNLAILFSLTKKHFQAIPHLKRVLEIDPKDVQARFLLAKELREAGLLQESSGEFLALYKANSDNEDVLLDFIKLLTVKGEHKQARDLLEKNYSQFPTRGRTAAALAYILAASPEPDLRDGNKALELAQKIYDSTKQIEHGALVAMAFAELGQCAEAARLIKDLMEQSAKSENQTLIAKLKNELNRYENAKPCRVKN